MMLIASRERSERRLIRTNAEILQNLLVRIWGEKHTLNAEDARWLKQVAREHHEPVIRTVVLRAVGWAAVGGRTSDVQWQPCPAEDLQDYVSILQEATRDESESARREAAVSLGRVNNYMAFQDPPEARFVAPRAFSGPPQTLLSERRRSLDEPFPSLVTPRELMDKAESMTRQDATEDELRWLMTLARRYKGLLQESFAMSRLLKRWTQRSWALLLRPGAARALHGEIVEYICAMLRDTSVMSRLWASDAVRYARMQWHPRIRTALMECCDDESTAISFWATHAMFADIWD